MKSILFYIFMSSLFFIACDKNEPVLVPAVPAPVVVPSNNNPDPVYPSFDASKCRDTTYMIIDTNNVVDTFPSSAFYKQLIFKANTEEFFWSRIGCHPWKNYTVCQKGNLEITNLMDKTIVLGFATAGRYYKREFKPYEIYRMDKVENFCYSLQFYYNYIEYK